MEVGTDAEKGRDQELLSFQLLATERETERRKVKKSGREIRGRGEVERLFSL